MPSPGPVSREFCPSSPPRALGARGLACLRARIQRIEGGTLAAAGAVPGGHSGDAAVTIGTPEVDTALPWRGLPRGGLHQILDGDGTAPGFAAALLARFAGVTRRTALWCRQGRGLYAPGLAAFGLTAHNLIVVRARTSIEVLWTMEESLRSGCLACVLGEAAGLDGTAARRLQLAAESGRTPAILLAPARSSRHADGAALPPLPALTRWRVRGALTASERATDPAWTVELLRCRGGAPAAWTLEWRGAEPNAQIPEEGDETAGRFAVASRPGGRGGDTKRPGQERADNTHPRPAATSRDHHAAA